MQSQKEEISTMSDKNGITLDPAVLLANAGIGQRIVDLEPDLCFFNQGGPADSVFYLLSGRAKLLVVSEKGKQATITLLSPGDVFGEESLATVPRLRLATAMAVNTCAALKVAKDDMIRILHEEPAFADQFLSCLLARSTRIQADLVDQILNSSEKRLARMLLLMAESRKPNEGKTFIPPITQEALAEMVGTTRSRVSFFMNRFRNLGLIEYKDRIQVHESRLKTVLVEQFEETYL
jgi:CRP-like cAMP-binding protein